MAGVIEPISEDGTYISEAAYWAKYYRHPSFNYEWNNGVLEEKPGTTVKQYATYDWFNHLLREFLAVKPIAKKLGGKFGFRLVLPEKTTIRKPDLFVVRNDNAITMNDHDRTYQGICDLCIESISDATPAEIEQDTLHKKYEYCMAGVQEYYILDPSGKQMKFYWRTPANEYQEFDAGAEKVIRSQVLPGFQFRIADMTRQPRLAGLIDDEVYCAFVLPEYRAERQRTEQAHRRVQEEQQLFERYHQRTDRLSARLRALGLNEDLE
jgi:Uma2 family endonuclease